jgi:hypothetical protein
MSPNVTNGAGPFLLLAMTLAVAPSPVAGGGEAEERLWILPFVQLRPDPAFAHLEDALPALLTVAVSGSAGRHTVVDREDLDRVLAEQSLSLAGLTSPDTRQRVGRLLGATVLIAGSFRLEGEELHLTLRASDVETGIVASAADGRGVAHPPGSLVAAVYRRLAAGMGRALPALAPNQMDEAPLSNLHFVKGLGHYYSARYALSLAEFMLASGEQGLADVSRFWMARAYLAERQYSQACLEFTRLEGASSASVSARGIRDGLRECERLLSSDDLRLIRDLARRGRRNE